MSVDTTWGRLSAPLDSLAGERHSRLAPGLTGRMGSGLEVAFIGAQHPRLTRPRNRRFDIDRLTGVPTNRRRAKRVVIQQEHRHDQRPIILWPLNVGILG